VQNQVEMSEKWMVKVGHPMELYTKSYKIHFFGQKKITNVWDGSYAANTPGGKSVVTQCYQAPIYCDIHKWRVNSRQILCGILGGMQC